ncbi:MAG: hypothetical protein EU539_05460 [Promethearchaeota archaeon]|nr:MAG: hypothetical protein EU539_05460 [Candidatus Lokiarchaeota archaeon]
MKRSPIYLITIQLMFFKAGVSLVMNIYPLNKEL